MGVRRAMPLPLGTMRFLPGLGARSRAGDEVSAGDEGSPRAVLRDARETVRTMRAADKAGRRAHADRDLHRFEAAWRSYQDAVQAYRASAQRWEALGALRPGALEDFPVAPPWGSNDLETETSLIVVDLAAAEGAGAVAPAPSGDTQDGKVPGGKVPGGKAGSV